MTTELRRPDAFCQEHPEFTTGQVRWWIHNSSDNGLAELGAIVRIGRAVYLDVPRFFKWIDKHRSAA